MMMIDGALLGFTNHVRPAAQATAHCVPRRELFKFCDWTKCAEGDQALMSACGSSAGSASLSASTGR
jgi:hypothetical protein